MIGESVRASRKMFTYSDLLVFNGSGSAGHAEDLITQRVKLVSLILAIKFNHFQLFGKISHDCFLWFGGVFSLLYSSIHAFKVTASQKDLFRKVLEVLGKVDICAIRENNNFSGGKKVHRLNSPRDVTFFSIVLEGGMLNLEIIGSIYCIATAVISVNSLSTERNVITSGSINGRHFVSPNVLGLTYLLA
jgi:hypothetical protein